MKNFNIICFELSRHLWKTIEWILNFSVDAHAHYTHFVIDRSIIFAFWTGCFLTKACSEHDVLWVLTNRQTEKLNFDHTNYITHLNVHKAKIVNRSCTKGCWHNNLVINLFLNNLLFTLTTHNKEIYCTLATCVGTFEVCVLSHSALCIDYK